MVMTVQEWIARIDRKRDADDLLSAGSWHGYLEDPLATYGATPMRGRYVLVRWESPTVAVSHDYPDEVIALARRIETALADEKGASGR